MQLDLCRFALESGDPDQLVRLFCRLTREFFRLKNICFWRVGSDGQLVGADGDGPEIDLFRGFRLGPGESSLALEAMDARGSVYRDSVAAHRYPLAVKLRAHSVMAATVMVFNEVFGVIEFLRDAESHFDNEVPQATLLVSQLGAALEAQRLKQLSREEHRGAVILAEVANALNNMPDPSSVIEGIADKLRVLLGAPAVIVFVQKASQLLLQAISTDAPALALTIRARYAEHQLRSASEIATRAIAAGERITVAVDASAHLGEKLPSGVLVAAPFKASRSQGAILVYPRASIPFSHEEKALVSALGGFGAVAVANAELYDTARGQAQELHDLLEISLELGSAGKLDHFMRTFVTRAASFLGFQRCFIGLLESDQFRVRWGVEDGQARPVDIPLYDGVATRTLKQGEVFRSENASTTPGANLEFVATFKIKQLLAVPLLRSNGTVLGMFGVLDKVAPETISSEDVRRARSLAAQAAIALELTRNLDQSEQHRRRAEALVGLALELNTVLHLPQFTRNLAHRAADVAGGRAVALTLFPQSERETVLFCGASEIEDLPLRTRLGAQLRVALSKHDQDVVYSTAAEILGTELAGALGWADCTLVRLAGASENLVGVLCLADRGTSPTTEETQLLRAVAGHAAIALENACLFTRMEEASRHWGEVFDAITDLIVVHDESHKILRVNRPLADFVGIATDQLIGVNMRALQALSQNSSPYSCPFCRNRDGFDEYVHQILERTYLVSTSLIQGADNRSRQTVHVLKDITDRREAERRYRELFDHIQEGIFFSTPQGRFIEVNDAFVQMLGYGSRNEVLQLDISADLYFSPRHRDEFTQLVHRDGGVRNFASVLKHKDGSPIHVLINAFAVRDSDGYVTQYRGLMLDVSGLRHSQTELQRERDFSNKILNHTQSLILVTGTDGVISYANRRWSGLGFEQNQLLGHSMVDLTAPVRRPALGDAFAAVSNGVQVDNLELQLIRADGSSGQFSVNLSPISGEDGSVSSVVVVMTDVTDATLLQSKLVHAEKMAAVGQLVSGVAHEVNNPLTAILGFTDLLMENPDLPESARRDLRVVLQEAQRTKHIVQNLLSFARQMPPQRRPVQINAILRRTVQLRAYDFHSHGVEIIERLDDMVPDVIGDSHQLQQVFLNILNNAHDAVEEIGGRAPRIEIATVRAGSYVEISFRDNGIGISTPDRIFDPFFTTKDVGKGTGLGLSICYGILREHGGEITCHNNLDSEGATFIVRLPLASETASFGAVAGVQPQ